MPSIHSTNSLFFLAPTKTLALSLLFNPCHLLLMTAFSGRYYCYPHFTEQETILLKHISGDTWVAVG